MVDSRPAQRCDFTALACVQRFRSSGRTWDADIISTAPCIWLHLSPSRRLKSTGFWTFLGDPFGKSSRIQRYLVRQWIHVRVSSRGCGRLCLATETGTHSANVQFSGACLLGSTRAAGHGDLSFSSSSRFSCPEDGDFASFLRHFSHSVHKDVECQGGGDARSLTPRRSATLLRRFH